MTSGTAQPICYALRYQMQITIYWWQQDCGTFDPAAFTSTGAPDGSGGTLNYVWQSSPDDAAWSDMLEVSARG